MIKQIEAIKKMCQSTTKLVQNVRESDKALCLIHRHRRLSGTIQRKRLMRKLQRSPPPLSAKPMFGVLDRREACHQLVHVL
jgi:hypothetical protein